jgi:TfoX/Sxy family transcriptional regulator of competence genes
MLFSKLNKSLINMATNKNFIEFITDQLEGAGEITSKMMFGEYSVYLNGKVVAFAADNKFFVKPTEAGRAFIGDPVEAPAYTGAKMSFLIEEQLEDREWLCELIQITAYALPEPKPKKKKGKK